MDQKSLEKNLANMERELLALQTAHDVGLGAVEYYEYNTTPPGWLENGIYYYAVLIEVASGEKIWPILESWGKSVDGDILANIGFLLADSGGAKFIVYTYSFNLDLNMKFRIVSTSQLNYHYASSVQQVKDWTDAL